MLPDPAIGHVLRHRAASASRRTSSDRTAPTCCRSTAPSPPTTRTWRAPGRPARIWRRYCRPRSASPRPAYWTPPRWAAPAGNGRSAAPARAHRCVAAAGREAGNQRHGLALVEVGGGAALAIPGAELAESKAARAMAARPMNRIAISLVTRFRGALKKPQRPRSIAFTVAPGAADRRSTARVPRPWRRFPQTARCRRARPG